jgi:hypothetical protein
MPIGKRRFRETARDILHRAKVKRQFGGAVRNAADSTCGISAGWFGGRRNVDTEPGFLFHWA